MNAYSNFDPDKTVTFNIRDPPWMKGNIKDKMSYRKFLKKRKQVNYTKLQNTIKELSELISTIKDDYN